MIDDDFETALNDGDGATVRDMYYNLRRMVTERRNLKALPDEPPEGLLMSMAVRYDHALGVPGYYDSQLGEGEHQKLLDATLGIMRQLYEEVAGRGFYGNTRSLTDDGRW